MGWLTFLNPAFLWGGLAASIPIIIHLINRRRARVVRFPAVAFVLRSERRVARKYRVKQWLLLALRTFILFLLTTALAEPMLQPERGDVAEINQARAVVLILDNSMSMAYQIGGATCWELAKELAGLVLQDLRPQDQGAVLPLIPATQSRASSSEFRAGDPDTRHPTPDTPDVLNSDRAGLVQEVQKLSLTHESGGFVAPFQLAHTLLQPSSAPKKEIVVITDSTRTPWVGFEPSAFKVIDPQVRVTVITVGSESPPSNVTVRDVRMENPPVVAGVRTKLTASLVNFGALGRKNLPVQLRVDDRTLDQRIVDLPQRSGLDVPFDVIFDRPGYRAGSIQLASDALPVDDTFYFTVPVRKTLRPLVIDGDPRTTLVASETFYLTNALNPERAGRPGPIQPRVVPVEEAESLQLGDFDVILLANVRALSASFRTRLLEFAKRGGGVWWFLGHQVDPGTYNRELFESPTRLLPTRLGMRLDRDDAHPVTLRVLDTTHPLLQPFAGPGQDALAGVRVRRLFTTETASLPSTTHVLLALPDGQPLLLAGEVGPGRVLLFTSTADVDWNELPVTTGYLPLVHAGVAYLARRERSERLGADVRIPHPIQITTPAEPREVLVTITDPQGKETRLRVEGQDGRGEARYPDVRRPGFYRLKVGPEEGLVAVNTPLEESDVTRIPPEELGEKFRRSPFAFVRWERGSPLYPPQVEPTSLAGWFLLGLLALALVEGVCANRLR
ncbi:MAG: BatA domain-containing protein [Nitrospinae bacterium]|nr:BatA domain-containing protein [Nitrospinota bacterium]